MFQNCSSLIEVVIPSSTTSIGEGVFNGCSALESLQVPFVGSSKCTNATAAGTAASTFGYVFGTISYEGGHQTVSYYTASASYTSYIPESLIKVIIIDEVVIQYGAFQGAPMTSVVLPNTLTTIQAKAFYDCDSLTSLVIPADVTSIGTLAVAECASLDTIEVKTTLVGTYMCQNCTSLTEATIRSLTSVADYAFAGCTSLKTVALNQQTNSAACTSIGAHAFDGCAELESMLLPNTITSIVNDAFANCISLTSILVWFLRFSFAFFCCS